MKLKECLEMIYVACTNYDKDITGKLGTEREYEGSYEQAYNTVLEELEGLQKENNNLRIALKSEEIISEDMPPETEFIIMTKANYLRNYKKKE